jgi:hypothetical protein
LANLQEPGQDAAKLLQKWWQKGMWVFQLNMNIPLGPLIYSVNRRGLETDEEDLNFKYYIGEDDSEPSAGAPAL